LSVGALEPARAARSDSPSSTHGFTFKCDSSRFVEMGKPHSIYHYLPKFPPCLVRLLAREKHGPPLTVRQISDRSALPVYQVVTLSQMTNWKGVDVETVRAFTHGCGLDLDDPRSVKRKLVYLGGQNAKKPNRIPPRFSYLRRSPEWETFFKPLFAAWRDSVYGSAPHS
jgi:hypothetical protein